IKDYSKKKAYSEENKDINRLYSVETTLSLTGAKADHRIAVKPSQIPEIAKAIAKALGVSGASSTYTDNAAWISVMAKDLIAAKGRSIVFAGSHQPPVVHALAHAMNSTLGNIGQTVNYIEPISPNSDKLQIDQLRELIADIDAGKVKMLVILGGNPVYDTPVDLKLDEERMSKVPLRVHLGSHQDETAEFCHWHISDKHYLESWSDARAYDGSACIVQPLINPLYDGHNAHEVVQLFLKENYDKKDYDIVKEYWQKQNITSAPASVVTPAAAPAPAAKNAATTAKSAPSTVANTAAPASIAPKTFEDHWRKAVHDGFIPNTAPALKTVSANTAFLSQPAASPAGEGELEFVILPDPCAYDGRFANNGWLQELPKPMNKVTWDNIALISAKTAEKLQINRGYDPRELGGGVEGDAFLNTKGGNKFADLVDLTYQGGQIKEGVPMWITPGQPDDVVTIYMGYGRKKAGKVGTGIGYNAFDVRRSDAMSIGRGSIKKRGEQADIASTQIHFNMEGRDLLRIWDLDQLAENPKLGEQKDMYPESIYPYEQHQETYNKNHKWAMTVDLNSCVGCNACVIACQSENNIAVVGKEQVNRSREMHWIRVDAYYGGDDPINPEGPHFQPVLCQQCEQAPCEVVCPVHATVHSAEGLNDMTYNRCVGTRYCSNNCPYKVRRFNFLLFQDWDTPQYKLMRNPEVTIRSRGVMEKCTYCVQR
ncbi:MAG: 4Fe-4S dicluster domain-containing protein, partial [Pyrinomonadaceae bacterium]